MKRIQVFSRTTLASMLLLSSAAALADDINIVPQKAPLFDNVARVGAGYEVTLDDGTKRALVEIEFYGIQNEDEPNRKMRLFWLEAKVADREALRGQPGRDLPEMYEVSLVPYSTTDHNGPTAGSSEVYEGETNHKWGQMQVYRDVRLGVNQGLRIRPYGFSTSEAMGDTERTGMGYWGNIDLLGYSLEAMRLKSGGEAARHYLHILSMNGSMRLIIPLNKSTRIVWDMTQAGIELDIPLEKSEEAPGQWFRGQFGSAAALQFYREDLKTLFAELKLEISGNVRGGAPVTRRMDGTWIEPKQQINNSWSYARVGATFTLFFE